jgi:hypothetical protein
MHFDWSWRTQFNRAYEDYLYSANAAEEGIFSGSQWFRKPRFSFWIGYDF